MRSSAANVYYFRPGGHKVTTTGVTSDNGELVWAVWFDDRDTLQQSWVRREDLEPLDAGRAGTDWGIALMSLGIILLIVGWGMTNP